MYQKRTTVTNFTVFGLPNTCLDPMWPPWHPHGATYGPFGGPMAPLGEPNGRHSDHGAALAPHGYQI